MSVHFLAAAVGTLIAAVGTGLLVARCLRAPGVALVAWTVALLGLTVSLGAQALGYHIGFGPVAFRVMEIGAQVVAPLALALGLAEVAAKSIVTRFAARLLLTSLGFVALVIFVTDPLSAANFGKGWPPTTVYYQIVPNKLLEYVLAPAIVIVALIAAGATAIRPARDPAWRDAVPVTLAAAAAALMLSVPGIVALLGLSVPVASLFTPLCVLAAVATWFAGARVGRLRFDAMRQGAAVGAGAGGEWGRQRSWADGPDATGDFDPVAADDEFGIYRNGSHREHGEAGYRPEYAGDTGYPDEAGYRDEARYPDEADYGYRDEAGLPGTVGLAADGPPVAASPPIAGGPPVAGSPPMAGGPPTAGGLPVAGGPPAAGRRSKQDLFGQIAIYTLLEDRVEDFDRLTRRVVGQVREHEPDTLVYIVHAVPSAPMQRILYEVYSDRAAHEAHKRQPYVLGFEAERRPYVLATNIIELGLQQAKVSPLPSVADLLSDTGFDLLRDTGFGRPGYGPRLPGGGVGGGGVGSGGLGGAHG
jgi:quinol monooxygenase YgiN